MGRASLRSWSGVKQKRSTRKKRFEKYTSGVGLRKLTLAEQADKGIETRVHSYNCAVVAVLLCLLCRRHVPHCLGVQRPSPASAVPGHQVSPRRTSETHTVLETPELQCNLLTPT